MKATALMALAVVGAVGAALVLSRREGARTVAGGGAGGASSKPLFDTSLAGGGGDASITDPVASGDPMNPPQTGDASTSAGPATGFAMDERLSRRSVRRGSRL